MTERAKQAGRYFAEGYNCAQSVAIAFEKELGMEKQAIARLMSSFGGGMGRLREVCGACSGMFMAAGLLYGYAGPEEGAVKSAHYALIRELAAQFEAVHGSIVCREILGKRAEVGGTPEKRTEEYYKRRPCAIIVEDAVMVLEQILEEGI